MPDPSPIDLDAAIWAHKRLWLHNAREGLHHFGPAVVRDDEGNPLEYSLLQLSWIAHVNYCWSRGLHAGIFTHGGANGFLVTMAAWLVGRDASERAKLVCASDGQARLCARAIRGIMKGPAFEQIFPDAETDPRWDERSLSYERPGQVSEPVIEARGVGNKPAGASATKLLFNSVVDADSANTYERRQAHLRLVEEVWLARLVPGGNVLWIAAPINPDDTSHAMRARLDFCWLEQRAKTDASGYEQEVHGAGDDYAEVTRGDLVAMLRPSTG